MSSVFGSVFYWCAFNATSITLFLFLAILCISLLFFFKPTDGAIFYPTWFKMVTLTVLIFNLILIIGKFLFFQYCSSYPAAACKAGFFKHQTLPVDMVFVSVAHNSFGSGLLLLCYITTLVSIINLGDKNIFYKLNSVFFFFFFLVCTTIMTNTYNLFTMFVSFEFIFVPSVFFVYILGYVKRVDKTVAYLVIWTLFGSFICFFGLIYVYTIHGTLNYMYLSKIRFTYNELLSLYIIFFFGFGIKIPVFPFYYWLLKVHVEAPAGFSMFLSGFLVKTALYCLYFFNLLFYNPTAGIVVLIVSSVGILDASLRMWSQTDIKRLVALATVQEMNMLVFAVITTKNFQIQLLVIFFLIHGLLSTLMFFIVDQIQIRTATRNSAQLSGFGSWCAELKLPIWVMLFLFLGIPYTAKFFFEFYVATYFLYYFGFFGLGLLFFGLGLGAVGFVKCWLLILYGAPSTEMLYMKKIVLTKTEYVTFNFLIFFMSIILFFFYI